MPNLENFPAPDKTAETELFGDLVQKCLDQTGLFQRMFFEGDELDIWFDRYRDRGTPIRALAMKWHRSRFTIRKTIAKVEKKLALLRQFFSA